MIEQMIERKGNASISSRVLNKQNYKAATQKPLSVSWLESKGAPVNESYTRGGFSSAHKIKPQLNNYTTPGFGESTDV